MRSRKGPGVTLAAHDRVRRWPWPCTPTPGGRGEATDQSGTPGGCPERGREHACRLGDPGAGEVHAFGPQAVAADGCPDARDRISAASTPASALPPAPLASRSRSSRSAQPWSLLALTGRLSSSRGPTRHRLVNRKQLRPRPRPRVTDHRQRPRNASKISQRRSDDTSTTPRAEPRSPSLRPPATPVDTADRVPGTELFHDSSKLTDLHHSAHVGASTR